MQNVHNRFSKLIAGISISYSLGTVRCHICAGKGELRVAMQQYYLAIIKSPRTLLCQDRVPIINEKRPENSQTAKCER